MDIFSKHLVEARNQKRLSQKSVAEMAGLKETTYQNYEYGKVKPSIIKMAKIADVLNVSLDFLCGRTDTFIVVTTHFAEDLQMAFARSIKREREKTGKTQKEMGMFLGVEERTYQAYELQEITPHYTKVIKLADFFETSLDGLLGRGE